MPYKPGIKTSELAVAVLVIVGQLVAALTENLSPHWAAIGSSVTAVGYALSRGWTKSGTSTIITTPAAAPTTVAPKQ